ncbi:unnamed protein product [Cylicocyclus nassatus]|uniref:Uncharacterized protein n=1 Tax=Cylicocyclus nassatus TaxID=53992 RepID=A0AA36DPZ5_CYLNA|nr:unnamed protein product [Cylicocyclus nassatus]
MFDFFRKTNFQDFLLDALNLGHYDLQGYRLDALRNSCDSFWLSLGESDEERDKNFNILLEQKSYWSSQIGICISEALEDIRYYRLHEGKLILAKKVGREDKARTLKQDWRRMALHMREV